MSDADALNDIAARRRAAHNYYYFHPEKGFRSFDGICWREWGQLQALSWDYFAKAQAGEEEEQKQ